MSGAKNKTRLSSRGVAATFLICCVLFSLLVLGGGKLSALRSDVLSAYDGGEGSIISDLTKHNENAYNIITVGKRVLGTDDSAITDAEAAYKAMNAAGMNDKDKTLVTGQKADMDSRDMIISHSDYNERVFEYAQAVSSFPGNLIAVCRGLGAPGYYR